VSRGPIVTVPAADIMGVHTALVRALAATDYGTPLWDELNRARAVMRTYFDIPVRVQVTTPDEVEA
jgi:hypothetical protein